jgi:hypothetical protein
VFILLSVLATAGAAAVAAGVAVAGGDTPGQSGNRPARAEPTAAETATIRRISSRHIESEFPQEPARRIDWLPALLRAGAPRLKGDGPAFPPPISFRRLSFWWSDERLTVVGTRTRTVSAGLRQRTVWTSSNQWTVSGFRA